MLESLTVAFAVLVSSLWDWNFDCYVCGFGCVCIRDCDCVCVLCVCDCGCVCSELWCHCGCSFEVCLPDPLCDACGFSLSERCSCSGVDDLISDELGISILSS